MKSIEELYDEQVELLKERGYASARLNNSEEEMSFTDLLTKLGEAYYRSLRDERAKMFYIKRSGIVDNKRNAIKLVFNYLYNPENNQLSLLNLFVTLNKVSLSFHIHNEPPPLFDSVCTSAKANYEVSPEKKREDFLEWLEQHKAD